MKINFICSRDSDETGTIHTKSNNIEIMIGNEADEIFRELFESLLQRYQEELEEPIRGSEFFFDSIYFEFFFDSIYLLCYKLHKISLNRSGSYIVSPVWLKNKKATINPKNNDDKCIQYALTVALNYQKIKNNPERISKVKLFIDQHNWKEIEIEIA